MGAILNAPIIVDAGKTSRGNINDLKQGRGKLLDDVQDAINEVATSLGSDAEGKQLIPVVLRYKKKERKSRRGSFLPLRLPILG